MANGLRLFLMVLMACLLGILYACSSDPINEEPPLWREDTAETDPRPDIVLVVSDDMRWDLMSARGHAFLKTPELDALAEQGAMMLNAFVPVAVCSQSRAAILTGKDVHKASAPVMVWKNNSFLQTQKTLASYLQEAGYTTAFIGKWHLGEGSIPKPGFDHWESFDWLGEFNDPVIYRNGEPIEHKGYVDDILSSRAHRVLYENREPGKPMFVMVSLKAPHLQFEHPARHAHAFADVDIPKPDTYEEDYASSGKPMGIFEWLSIENHPCGLKCFANSWQQFIKYHYRAVLGLDDQIGVLRDAIAAGRKPENTLFIYTSDNGYSLGDHGLSAKHFVYEEPVRVPFLVDAPGLNDIGRRSEALVSTTDIAPTILDYADIDIPSDMSGRSLRPLLESEAPPLNWRDSVFLMYEKERHTVPTQVAIRTEQYKLIQSVVDSTNYELYDLQVDPQETTNVYAEPHYAKQRGALRRKLAATLAQKQWTPRTTFPVNSILVSNPVSIAQAQSLAHGLSVDTVTVGDDPQSGLNWREIVRDQASNTMPITSQDVAAQSQGQAVLVVLPFERIVDWDPFVHVMLTQGVHADAYVNNEMIYSTKVPPKPGDVINPPLVQSRQHVLLVVDISSAQNFAVNLRVASDTIRLPLENKILGSNPGRFYAANGWQPHSGVEFTQQADALELRFGGDTASIVNDRVYLDETVLVEVQAHTDSPQPVPVTLTWYGLEESWQQGSQFDFEIDSVPGSGQQIILSPVTPVEVLQFRFNDTGSDIAIQRITVRSQDGEFLYDWDFTQAAG